MLYSDEQIEQVRNISIADRLGVRLNGRKINICCPHPDHHDHTPSFQLRPDNSFKCFGCNGYGRGWISFCKFMGFEFKEIMDEFVSK